jgi:chromosome segregation ATPase
MPEVGDVAFELERFGWSEPGQLEVVGRWSGLEGRRLGRPVLTVEAGGQRRRLSALPGGRLAGTGEWRATFACDDDPDAIANVELEIGRRLVVDLPPPRRRRRAKADQSLERLHEERLRREAVEATLAERDAELVSLREEADAALAEREEEAETLRGDGERLGAELTVAREALAASEQERERLARELERVTADLAIRDEELSAAREELRRASVEAEERLAAERAATTEVREKLATAREEAESTITAEAQQTERLRAELEAAREETERTVNAERAETARLREDLATQAGDANGDDAESAAAKRMYERIARELEHERAAARSLRRELDAVQAQTAEHRRTSSALAANGITEDTPAAATPAGRLVAARRTEVGRAAAHQRAEAARAAAAQRVPHGHRSQTAVWAIRVAALVFVAALLVALLLIVSWVA